MPPSITSIAAGQCEFITMTEIRASRSALRTVLLGRSCVPPREMTWLQLSGHCKSSAARGILSCPVRHGGEGSPRWGVARSMLHEPRLGT